MRYSNSGRMAGNHRSNTVSVPSAWIWLHSGSALTFYQQTNASLEVAYEQVQRKLDHTYGQESARRLRIAIAHLRNENDELRRLQSNDGRRIEELRGCLAQAETDHHVVAMEAHSMRDGLRLVQRKLESAEVSGILTTALLKLN